MLGVKCVCFWGVWTFPSVTWFNADNLIGSANYAAVWLQIQDHLKHILRLDICAPLNLPTVCKAGPMPDQQVWFGSWVLAFRNELQRVQL